METVIFGNGLLGNELNKQVGWAVYDIERHGVDIIDPNSYRSLLLYYNKVINCIGYTNTNDNTKDKHWEVNFKGVINLVNECNRHKVKLIHISTDYIYTNSQPYAKETDIPIHYDNWYTYTKLLADGYVQAMSNDYLLFRTSFKPRPFPWDAAWSNLVGNFAYVDEIVPLMIDLINKNATGVYNIGKKEHSMYCLGKESNPEINSILKSEPPYDISMDLTKMNES